MRDAPVTFEDFRIAAQVRTPKELVRHMTSVLGYARTCFVGGSYWPEPLSSLNDEIDRFHEMVEQLSRELQNADAMPEGLSVEQLPHAPLSDAMTHAGQLAMLRRLAGHPVAPENFIFADIKPERLGTEQASPVSPDEEWPEAPARWQSPSQRE